MRHPRVTVTAATLAGALLILLPGARHPALGQGDKQEPKLPAPLAVEGSMHEFMEYYFEPAFLRLQGAMRAKDKDKASWKAIKADALVLAEGANLLLARLPAKDAGPWANHAFAVREAGTQLYQGARKKDEAVVSSAYKTMLTKCNACHQQFDKAKHVLKP